MHNYVQALTCRFIFIDSPSVVLRLHFAKAHPCCCVDSFTSATSLTIPAKVALSPIHTVIASSQFGVGSGFFILYFKDQTHFFLLLCRFGFRILLSTRRRLAFLLRTYANLA